MSQNEEFKRVWQISDYGNLANIEAVQRGAGRAGTSGKGGAMASSLTGSGLQSILSTIEKDGKIVPTPATQKAAQGVLQDPKAYVAQQIADDPEIMQQQEGFIESGKSMLSKIFNTDDEKDLAIGPVNLSGVETVWDGFFGAVGWTYDRLAQLESAGLSVLPGGIETLSWEEAGKISPGQVVVGGGGVSAGKVRRGEASLGDYFSVASIPGAFGYIFGSDSPIQKEGWNIKNEEDRKVFQQGAEQFFSGMTDFGLAFADPLIVGGKVAKLARLKYIDRPLTNPANRVAIMDEIVEGQKYVATGEVEKMSPVARFIYEAVTPRADGTRMTARELIQREEVQWSGDAEGIADALTTVRNGDYNSAALVIGAGLMDGPSYMALIQRSITAADSLAMAKRGELEVKIASDPQLYTTTMYDYSRRSDNLYKVYTETKKNFDEGNALQSDVDKTFMDYTNSVDDLLAIERGVLGDPLALASPESVEWAARLVDEAVADNEWIRRALNEAKQGAFVNADRGFASDTAIGKFVSARRAKRARKDYERLSTSRQGWRSKDFYGAGRFTRTLRVWSRGNDETPSYYLATSGAAATDQGREIEAYLNGFKFLSGEAKVVTLADGTTKTVGGIALKDRIFADYIAARTGQIDTGAFALQMEKTLTDELGLFYGLDKEVAEHVYKTAVGKREELTNKIRQHENGFFTEASERKVLQMAPFLETQLRSGTYLLPLDEFENVLINIAKGKIKDPRAQVLYTKGQWAADKAAAANDIFQDIWRPAVLFRLGYPIRNTMEGVFRAMAFQQSLTPLWYAVKGVSYSPGNFRREARAAKRVERAKAELAAKGKSVDRQTFDDLVIQQRGIQTQQRLIMAEQAKLKSKNLVRDDALQVPVVEWYRTPSGLRAQSEAFDIKRVTVEGKPSPLKWVRQSDGNYVADNALITKTGAREYSVIDASGNIQKFSTLKAAKEAVEAARPQQTEKFVIGQLDPVSTEYIYGKGVFDDLEQAQTTLQLAVETAFNKGGKFKNQPQLSAIADKGAKARAIDKPSFTDKTTGRTFTTADEMQVYLDELKDEMDVVTGLIDDFQGRPVPAALMNTKLQKWRKNQIEALDKQITEDMAAVDNLNNLAKELGVTFDDTQRAQRLWLRQQIETNQTLRRALERDDSFALEMYGQQAGARKMVASPSRVQVDAVGLSSNAWSNPYYAAIARQNMSADNTVKATLTSRANLAESIFFKKIQDMYVDVTPGSATYWDGMASMLRQYSQSELGQKILRGDSVEDIAMWLLSSKNGREIAANIDEAWVLANGRDTVALRIGDDLGKAVNFVEEVRDGLVEITAGGNPEVWALMQVAPPTPQQLKGILQNSDNLVPVVGYTEEIIGNKTVMDAYRTITQKAFRKIGTQVEDTLVRGPFYSQRFTQTQKALMDNLLQQYKDADRIPLELVLAVDKQAHKRALKDTKDFLYTIDRRTNLGKYGEVVFPFISATQNSVTALGRLIRKDPALPGEMLLLWNAPTRMGWEDENGNLIIPLPKSLIPDGVEDFFGLTGISNVSIPKSSINVIFPESGYGFVPRPTPWVQASASELMKRGLFGQFTVEAPKILVSLMGQKDATTFWNFFKDYTFGEQGAVSTETLSWDKLAPPIGQKLVQYVRKDAATQYGYQYGLQARTQDLLWKAGERDNYPDDPQEIMDRTNGMFLLRMMGNAFSPFQIEYPSPVQPVIDIQTSYDKVYGLQGPQKFSEKFGDGLLPIANQSSTRNTGGLIVNDATVANIRKNSSLLRNLSDEIGQDDLDVLGILVNVDDPNSVYDPNLYRWLTTENIPGTSRTWREPLTGAESIAESQRQAGWTVWMRFKNDLDAMLADQGLTSYSQAGAERLVTYRKEFEDMMLNDPTYAGWAADFRSIGSSQTHSAVTVITRALGDEQFMADKGDSKTWQCAYQYIQGRNVVIDQLEASGQGINAEANAELKAEWDSFRQDLINKDEQWANIANRFLRADDEPEKIARTTYGAQ